MKHFILPSTSTGFFHSLLFLLASSFVVQTTYALPTPFTTAETTTEPSTEAAPANHYSTCEEIPATQAADRKACNKHFQPLVHTNGIQKITYDQTDLTGLVTADHTLYIFDSDKPGLSKGEQVEFDVPESFSQPVDSGLVGNLISDKRPVITTAENASTAFVVSANQSTGTYLLADIEIDSSDGHSGYQHSGVLDLKGAELTVLNNVKVVRRPFHSLPGGYESVNAIELGCSPEQISPIYQIIDSVIDISEKNLNLVRSGSAFVIQGCDDSTNSKAKLMIRNSTILIGFAVDRKTAALASSSGSVFDFRNLVNQSISFDPGSTCNHVITPTGKDLSMALMSELIGRVNDGAQVFSGLFGLHNGFAWGMRSSLSHIGEYEAVLEPWGYWLSEFDTDPTCTSCVLQIPFLQRVEGSYNDRVINAAANIVSAAADILEPVRFSFDSTGSPAQCHIKTEITGIDTGAARVAGSPLQLVNLSGHAFTLSKVTMPLPEWSPYPKDYWLVIAPRRVCDQAGACRPGITLAGRAYSSSGLPGNSITRSDDFFIVTSQSQASVENARSTTPTTSTLLSPVTTQTAATPEPATQRSPVDDQSTIYSCSEITALLPEKPLTGTVAFQPEPGSVALQQSAAGLNLLDVQCLRNDQGSFQLIADAEIPIQYDSEGVTTAMPLRHTIKAMLTAHYQPGDERLIWYDLEVGLSDSEGSANTVSPVLVPTTSIVLEQVLSP